MGCGRTASPTLSSQSAEQLWPPRRRSVLMKAHNIAALLRRIDALLERAARARQEMENAKASRAERHLVLTGTRGIWRRNMHAWLRRRGR